VNVKLELDTLESVDCKNGRSNENPHHGTRGDQAVFAFLLKDITS